MQDKVEWEKLVAEVKMNAPGPKSPEIPDISTAVSGIDGKNSATNHVHPVIDDTNFSEKKHTCEKQHKDIPHDYFGNVWYFYMYCSRRGI